MNGGKKNVTFASSASPGAPRTVSFATNDVHAYPEPARTRSRLVGGRGRSPSVPLGSRLDQC